MVLRHVKLMLLALACALVGARAAAAQTAGIAPATPQPADAQAETIAPGQTVTQTQPPAARLPSTDPVDPPVPYYSGIPVTDDVPRFDPRLELPGIKLGWIASVEAGYVQPFLSNHLNSGGLAVGNVPGTVQVPTAQTPWLVLPRLDFGYRFGEGLGEMHAIARFLGGEGVHSVANFDAAGAGSIATRLNLYTLDLDYAFLEFNPGRVRPTNELFTVPGRLGLDARPENEPPTFLMLKWFYGARLANVFFDSRGTGAQILSERVMNNFVGAGPRIGAEVTKPIPGTRLALYGRLEFSGLLGNTTQSFARSELVGGTLVGGSARQSDLSLGVPVVGASLGARYMPPWANGLGISAGYQFEQWWYLGTTSSSDAGLTLQGVFLRGEMGF
jgi:hypothetical protein